MRTLAAAVQSALAARSLSARDFLSVFARNRTTGATEFVGFWSDVGAVSASVIDPDTGAAVTRSFYGSGSLIQVSDIPLTANAEVQQATIQVSQIDDLVNQAVRLYDCKQARIQIHRGLFDPLSNLLVAPAVVRFVGFVDTINVKTGAENEDGGITFTAKSHTQEFTRANADTRSDASQKLRNATDAFYKDTSVVGDWELFWGRKNGKLTGDQGRRAS